MNVVGGLSTPYTQNPDGSFSFELAGSNTAVDLHAEFTIVTRKIEEIDAKGALTKDDAAVRSVLRSYLRTVRAAYIKLTEKDDEPISLDPPAPAAPVAVAEVTVAPAVVVEAEIDRLPAEIVTPQGDQYRVVTADIDRAAAAINSDQLEAVAATLRPGVLIPEIVDGPRPTVETAIFAASTGSLRTGTLGAPGQRTSYDEVGQHLKSIADMRATRPETHLLYRRDRLAGIDGAAQNRVQPGRMTDPANAAALDWQRRNAEALIAALCGPGEIDREQRMCSASDARPLAGLFGPPVAVGMGIHEFFRSIGLADLYAYFAANPDAGVGMGLWTSADQAAVDPADPATWKQCMTLPTSCPPSMCVSAYWLYRCLKVSLEDQMARPQYVENLQMLLEVLLARLGEQTILQSIDAWSQPVTIPGANYYSALDQLHVGVATLLAQAGSNFRAAADLSGYALVVPEALLITARVDAWRAGGTGSDVTDALRSVLQPLGISLEVTPDWGAEGNLFAPLPAAPYPGGPAATPITLGPLPTTYVARLVAPEDFVWGSVAVEDYGVDTSPELKRQNCVQYFGETAEIFYKKGCSPSFTITFTDVCPSGARPDRIAPIACAATPADASLASIPELPAGWPASQVGSC